MKTIGQGAWILLWCRAEVKDGEREYVGVEREVEVVREGEKEKMEWRKESEMERQEFKHQIYRKERKIQ